MSVIEGSTPLQRTRIAFFYAVVGAVILVLAGGLAYRQLFSSGWFLNRERLQSQRRILIPGPRGEIYDREGRVLVANRPRFTAVLYFSDTRLRRELLEEESRLARAVRAKQAVSPPEGYDARARKNVVQRYLDQCGRILHQHFTVDTAGLERHFLTQPLLPYPIIQDLEPTEFAGLIEQLPIGSPVQILPSTARHYPYGSAAAHMLGYVTSTLDVSDEGLAGSDLRTFFGKGSFGRDGIERQLDSTLQGQTGSEIWTVDPAGFQVSMVKNQLPVSGHPVYTSIDIDLQLAGEEAFGDQEGALVAMDVNTGEVLALVSEPSYDLNDTTPFISNDVWADINKREALMNRAIQGLYPPGSTFKIITAMAALRAGVLTPGRIINCPGYIMIGNRRLNCDNHSGHGPINFVEAMRESCNVYFATLGLEVGVDKLAAEAKRFGLDHPTGIELPGEARAMIVPSPEWKKKRDLGPWVDGDTGNMSIGQGFDLFTPLQMACFMASFARNETATVPTILRRNTPGLATTADNHPIGLSAADRALIIEGMEKAASTGTAKLVAVPGVRLAAKTGTAEKDVWDKGRKRNMDLAWTTAFGPVERPTIAVTVVIVGDPGKSTWGGQTAAPIAQKVLAKYFAKHPPPKPPAPIVAGDVNAPR